MKRTIFLVMLIFTGVTSKAESLLIKNLTGCEIVLHFNIAEPNFADNYVGPLVLPPMGPPINITVVPLYYSFISQPVPPGITSAARFYFYWVSVNGCNRDYDFPTPSFNGTGTSVICPKALCNSGNDITRTLTGDGAGNFTMTFQ